MSRHPITAVLFDLDNTLVNRSEVFTRLFGHWYLTRPSQGRPADKEAFVERMAKHADSYRHLQDIYREVLEIWPGSFSSVDEAVRAHSILMPQMVQLDVGTEKMLKRFKSAGIPVGVVTNGGSTVQWGKLHNTGIADLVTACVVSEEFGARKPDPSIFARALELIGAFPESTLFVGDNPDDDIVGANSMGMPTAWISLGRSWEMASVQPDYILAAVWEVEALGSVDI